MKVTLSQKLLPIWLATCTVFAGTLGFSANGAMVVCIGDDGHVEREASIHGVCVSDAVAENHQHEADCAALVDGDFGDSHCGPCTDVALSSSERTATPQQRLVLHSPVHLIYITPARLVSDARDRTGNTVGLDGRHVYSNSHLRSVSLRI